MPRFRPIGYYGGLTQGPNVGRQFVGAKSRPIDGTKQKLRDSRLGSPFTFRVAAPDLLLDALMGGAEAHTRDAFDPKLRQVYREAEANLEQVRAQAAQGLASPADVRAAEQALLGGRAPAQGQNIAIIESATRYQNNFNEIRRRRNAFRQPNTGSTFFAVGPTRPGLRNIRKVIGANGVAFNPDQIDTNAANQAAVSDLVQALDVILQINKLLNTPSLTLLVNPERLSVTYAKRQQYQDRNRYNYIFQSWGEEQVRLSISGKAAGFVVGSQGIGDVDVSLFPSGTGAVNVSRTEGVSGYQWASKQESAAWQNFMSLFQFYRNNGYIYDTVNKDVSSQRGSEAHLFIGTVEISYDQWVYVGNFENFQYSFVENKQHGALEFGFEFVASSVFDRSQGGVAPVRPYGTPPTPSPSQAPEDPRPVLTDPAPKTARQLESPQGGTPSTSILQEGLDPVAESRAYTGPTAAPGQLGTVDPFANRRQYTGPTSVPRGPGTTNPFTEGS